MGLFVDTVSATVNLSDLGITLIHPTTNYNIGGQFDAETIRKSADLYNAIVAGQLNWKLTSGGTVQAITNFDPDFFELDQEETGAGYNTSKAFVVSNSTLTLTPTHVNKMFFTGTTVGQIIKMPVATQCNLGHDIEIFNLSTRPITVQYQDSSPVVILNASSKGQFTLQDNTTANGNWFFIEALSDVASGILNYNITASALFTTSSATDAQITGFSITPVAGRYAIWFSANCEHTTNNANIIASIYANSVKVTDSERTTQTVSSNFKFLSTTQTTVVVNGSQPIDVRVRRLSNGTLSITGRSLLLIRLGNS